MIYSPGLHCCHSPVYLFPEDAEDFAEVHKSQGQEGECDPYVSMTLKEMLGT